MLDYKIFVTTDTSDKCSGAVLSFGSSWESACPVAFDSMMFKNAELNYLVHKKEMLAMIRALKKWHVDLLGSPFFIYTDHKTLENFNVQKDLLCHQAWWMEFMSQFNTKIVYIKGNDNTVADALSRFPSVKTFAEAEKSARHPYRFCEDDNHSASVSSIIMPSLCGPRETAMSLSSQVSFGPYICTTLKITVDKTFLQSIRQGYADDAWCKTLSATSVSWPELQFHDGLWYIRERLIIPRTGKLRKTLFILAHNVLGHFSFNKTYSSLRNAYYWLNMWRDLELGYAASCPDCQRNKSSTIKPYGPLHPLPIPDQRGT